ncbi:septum formation initiator family protein [Nannocystaceae bacterium ST9]
MTFDSIRRLLARPSADDDSRPEPMVRRRARKSGADARPHGFRRAEDEGGERAFARFDRRRADGTPLLLFTVLAVLTCVGLARVQSRIEILDVANEITELSEDHQRLLDRKRRLETERAYLRRPERVRAQARERLGMEPAPPERIQRIELLPAATLDADSIDANQMQAPP